MKTMTTKLLAVAVCLGLAASAAAAWKKVDDARTNATFDVPQSAIQPYPEGTVTQTDDANSGELTYKTTTSTQDPTYSKTTEAKQVCDKTGCRTATAYRCHRDQRRTITKTTYRDGQKIEGSEHNSNEERSSSATYAEARNYTTCSATETGRHDQWNPWSSWQ